VVRYKLDDHVLSLTLGDLIKVSMVDTTVKEFDFDGIDSVLESPSIDSVTISGHVLTFWGVYSGVNVSVSSGNAWYQFVYYFTQAAREKLEKAGVLSDGDIATVIVINTDSLDCVFKDDEGDLDIDDLGTVVDGKAVLDARVVDGVMTLESSDTPIFGMPPEYLRHDSLGTTDIEVQKVIAVKANKQLLIEKFSAVATAKLPDGDIQHNATLGSYFTTGGSSADLENYRRGSQSFTASANGTLDSVRIYMVNVTGSAKNLRAAIYNYVTTSDSSLVDVTNQQAVSASGTVKIDFPAPTGSVVSGQTYLIAVWASSATGFCDGYHRSGTSYNERYSSATYGTYPDPYTYSSTSSGYEMSVQVYYTEATPAACGDFLTSPTAVGKLTGVSCRLRSTRP
jgi:hypothetical protein